MALTRERLRQTFSEKLRVGERSSGMGGAQGQMQTYPKSRLLDIYKSCFQDFMGAEHLVADRERVKAYLDEELATTRLEDMQPWYFEPCGTDSCYYRISIRVVMEGIVS